MLLMRLTLLKDARRLWPVAGMTYLMLAALANADRWRGDWIASAMEGWMNLLLTGAWACLAALVVLEDPLVGDRHIWMTRPHPWPALLGAKLALVVLAIHVPAFLADTFVLSARGFPPALYVGELLAKQLLFFACVVLPAMATAALLRSFTHFVIVLFAVTAGIAMLNGGLYRPPEFNRTQDLRQGLVLFLIAGASVAVVCMQYARRVGLAARTTALAGGLSAVAVFAYMPPLAEYAVHGASARVALRNATPDASMRFAPAAHRRPIVFLPIAITPDAQGSLFRVPLVEIEIVTQDGTVIRSVRPTSNRPFEQLDLLVHPYAATHDKPPEWLALTFSRSAWQRVGNSRVRIRGSAGLELYRLGETAIMPVDGTREIPAVGRCTAATVTDRVSESLLKVVCESPRDIPGTYVRLRHAPSQRVWLQGLNWAWTYAPGPKGTWLSPLERAQSFFQLTDTVEAPAGAQWLVPASYLPAAHLEVTPVIVIGRAHTTFEFADVMLSAALAQP